MKLPALTLQLVCAAWMVGTGGVAFAQLGDNEESKAFIAKKCAESSGGSSEQYAEYAERLAKTFSKVPTVAQGEILGVQNPTGNLDDGSGDGGTGDGGAGDSGEGSSDQSGTGDDDGSSEGNNGSGNGWGGSGGGWWGGSYTQKDLTKGLAFTGSSDKKATASVTFSSAVMAEIEPAAAFQPEVNLTADEIIVSGSLSQRYDPYGDPVYLLIDLSPARNEGKVEFKNGKLLFLTGGKEKAKK